MNEFSNILSNEKSTASQQKTRAPFFRHVIQPKLSINQPGDVYEQEADTMADKVMRMPDTANDNLFFKPGVNVTQQNNAGPQIQRQDHGEGFYLPPIPHYELQMPRIGEGLGRQERFSRFGNPFRSPFASQFRMPLLQYVPPLHLTLTPEQIQQILGQTPTNFHLTDPSSPASPSSSDDGVRLGGDQFRDPISGNDQITAVARGLDVAHFKAFNTLFDVLHEPSVTFSAARPGSGADNSVQLGIALLNIHLSDRVEFAPVQLGVDTEGGISAGSQLEIHTNDPHWSYFINLGYSMRRNDNGNYQFDSTGISFSFFPHFLNP